MMIMIPTPSTTSEMSATLSNSAVSYLPRSSGLVRSFRDAIQIRNGMPKNTKTTPTQPRNPISLIASTFF